MYQSISDVKNCSNVVVKLMFFLTHFNDIKFINLYRSMGAIQKLNRLKPRTTPTPKTIGPDLSRALG